MDDIEWMESQEFTVESEPKGVLVTVTLYNGEGEPSFVERRSEKMIDAIRAVRKAVAS
jgi:hypothetical protein